MLSSGKLAGFLKRAEVSLLVEQIFPLLAPCDLSCVKGQIDRKVPTNVGVNVGIWRATCGHVGLIERAGDFI